MPEVQVVDSETLGGMHGGAYSQETDTIYISAELLESDPELAAEVMLEEVGHAIDARVNESDTKGDEGEIFGRLVNGETLSDAELNEIRAEDDSGTITIGGRRIEVEYSSGSDVVDAVTDVFDSVFEFFEDVFNGIVSAIQASFEVMIEVIKEHWEAIKKAFEKLMASELFGWIMTALQFFQWIPIVAVIVTIYRIVKAVYMVYQGIKHGSLSMVLSGIASMATGAAKLGTLLGASANTVGMLTSIAEKATMLSNIHKAISEKDFGAAWEILTGDQTVSKAMAVHDAIERGDVIGALNLGYNLLDSLGVEMNSEIAEAMIKYASTIDQVVKAVENGDYSQAAVLLNDTFGKDMGLSEETRAHFEKAAATFEKLEAAKEAIESGDYALAGGLLAEAAASYAGNEELSAALAAAGEKLAIIAEVVKLAEAGDYAGAMAKLDELREGGILDPALIAVVAEVEGLVAQVEAAKKAIDNGDYAAAAEIYSDIAANYATSEESAAEFRKLANQAATIAEAVDLAKAGKYEEALAKLDEAGIVDPAIIAVVAEAGGVAAQIETANKAIERGDYAAAAGIYADIAAKYAPNEEAAAAFRKLATQAATIAEAVDLAEAGKYTEALLKLEEIGVVDPALVEAVAEVEGLVALVEDANTAIENGDYAAAAAIYSDIAANYATSEESAAEFRKLASQAATIAEAVDLAKAGKHEEALAKLNEAGIVDPAVIALVAEAGGLATQLETANKALDRGDYAAAAGIYTDIAAKYAPNEESAAAFRKLATQAATIAEAVDLAEAGKYTEALLKLEEIGVVDPALVEAVAEVEGLVALVEDANTAIDNGDYAAAAAIYSDIAANYATNEESAAKFRAMAEQLAIIAEAVDLAGAGQYEEAMAKLNEAGIVDPALVSLVADVERWVEGIGQFQDAVEQDDYAGAAVAALDLAGIDAETETRALFAKLDGIAQIAEELKSAIDSGDWSAAYKAAKELASSASDPALAALFEQLAAKLQARIDEASPAQTEVAA